MFAAESIRKERTGIHAKIAIGVNDKRVGWTQFNVERDEDRVRLTNSAARHISPEILKVYPKDALKHDLDLFCYDLWSEWLACFPVERLGGDPDLGPPGFALWPYIVLGGGTIAFAPPKRGKSATALLMAVSVDAGSSQIWEVKQPRKVLFANLERSRTSLQRRIGATNRVLGLPVERELLFMQARGRTLWEIADGLEDCVKREGVEVVFLDSISRAGQGDLTENRPANSIMDTLNRICNTWLALAHTPRQTEAHAYGSIFFDAAADIILRFHTQRHPDGYRLGVGLHITDCNDFSAPPMDILALDFRDDALTEVRPARRGEFIEIEAGRTMTASDAVLEYLTGFGKCDVGEIAEGCELDRSTVQKVVTTHSSIRREKEGKRFLYLVKTEREQG